MKSSLIKLLAAELVVIVAAFSIKLFFDRWVGMGVLVTILMVPIILTVLNTFKK